MKHKLKYIVPLVFGIIFLGLGYKVLSMIRHKNQIAKNIEQLPLFAYQTTSGTPFTNTNLKKNTPIIFFYYNSECEFCNHEAQMVADNIGLFSKYQLVFVSFEKADKIKAFAQHYKLNSYDAISFAMDTKLSFTTTFDVKTLPAIVIYDQNHKLVKKLKGQTKPERILELLKA